MATTGLLTLTQTNSDQSRLALLTPQLLLVMMTMTTAQQYQELRERQCRRPGATGLQQALVPRHPRQKVIAMTTTGRGFLVRSLLRRPAAPAIRRQRLLPARRLRSPKRSEVRSAGPGRTALGDEDASVCLCHAASPPVTLHLHPQSSRSDLLCLLQLWPTSPCTCPRCPAPPCTSAPTCTGTL